MKAWLVHYMNKYPGSIVEIDDNRVAVYCQNGKKRIQIEKNGANQWQDVSDERGCEDRHDLAPIPRDCRIWKLYKDGRVARDEEAASREAIAQELAGLQLGGPGKIPSSLELAQAMNPQLTHHGFTDHRWEWQKNRPAGMALPSSSEPKQLEQNLAIPAEFQRISEDKQVAEPVAAS